MKTFLTFFVLFFSSSVLGDDISDFEIGGMKIGDSLLDFMSEEKIIEQINRTKHLYDHIGEEFGEVYIYESSLKYDYFTVWVKTPYITKDDYSIYSIRGVKIYNGEDIDQCYKKMKVLEKNISNEIPSNVEKQDGPPFKHRIDPSGRSFVKEISFRFDTGDFITIQCSDFEENLRIKNNWNEGLSFGIRTYELYKWFRP